MSASKIEWTDETWNVCTGCTKVSDGCKHCYVERIWPRLAGNPKHVCHGRKFTDIQRHPERLDQPLHWKRKRMVFVNSMSDLFHEDVSFEFIDEVFAIMAMCQQHTFQILTKRPERMREYTTSERIINVKWPLPNVWLGVSIEDQQTADERIPLLLQTPAAVRFVSAEPLLGLVDLCYSAFNGADSLQTMRGIDWVIVGGESGPKARPMNPQWARDLRDQCKAAGVPFFFKQWGEWTPNWLNDNDGNMITGSIWMDRVGKKAAGCLLDGIEHKEMPEVKNGTRN